MERKRVLRKPRSDEQILDESQPAGAELVDEMEELLAEIDRALEENELEVVRNYQQRGGQ